MRRISSFFMDGLQIICKTGKAYAALGVMGVSNLLFHNAFQKVKDPPVDVRLIKKGDTLTIRLRNNGQSLFDGEELKMEDSDDPCANVGIKLLQKLTEDISCNSILGLNVITIKLAVAGDVSF